MASVSVNTTLATPTSAPATATAERVTGSVDPEFQISKKYPTTGDITGKANLTISVIPPLTFSEAFTGFWDKYGTPIITSGVAAVSFTYVIDVMKRRKGRRQIDR